MEQLLIGIAAFLVGIVITRSVYSIPERIKHQKAMIALLIMIAKNNGSTVEEIDEMITKVYGKK